MARVSRGPNFQATFIAAASTAALYEPVYISASGTVAVVTTQTNTPIGVVTQKSNGTGTAVGVDMFIPSRICLAAGAVTAGARQMISTGTATFIDAAGTATGVPVCGIAVTSATDSGEQFEMIPTILDQVTAF